MVKESSEVDDIEDELLNEKWMEFGNRDNVADVDNDEDGWLYEENNHVDRWGSCTLPDIKEIGQSSFVYGHV